MLLVRAGEQVDENSEIVVIQHRRSDRVQVNQVLLEQCILDARLDLLVDASVHEAALQSDQIVALLEVVLHVGYSDST